MHIKYSNINSINERVNADVPVQAQAEFRV